MQPLYGRTSTIHSKTELHLYGQVQALSAPLLSHLMIKAKAANKNLWARRLSEIQPLNPKSLITTVLDATVLYYCSRVLCNRNKAAL